MVKNLISQDSFAHSEPWTKVRTFDLAYDSQIVGVAIIRNFFSKT